MASPNTKFALSQGHGLHEYRIESVLGVGGFGLTYLATDANLKLKVAIKEYLPADLALRGDDLTVQPKSDDDTASFKWGLDRFLDESRALASFRHPNIVRVMRFFEANNTAYMVMEFVAGDALSDWVRTRRPLDEPALLRLLEPVLQGLEVVHSAGYLHRDIKPANIFIRQDGSPVLLDFGSARMVTGNTELTAIVTPGYAPLEQYHNEGRQGPWSDLYALGGVLYWLVTGNKPVDAAARVRSDPMPAAVQAGDAGRYSRELLSVIDWMLMPNEDHRPQSVADVQAALKGDAEKTAVVTQTLSRRAAELAAQPPAPAGVALDAALLQKVQAELAQHIGPIASVVVGRAAKKSASLEELVNAVAKEIEDDEARTRFLRRQLSGETTKPSSDRSMPSGRSGSVPTALAMKRFDAEVLDRCEKELAQHLGPLARVVVKRAAMKARDETELYLLVGDEIEDKDERKAFVRKLTARR